MKRIYAICLYLANQTIYTLIQQDLKTSIYLMIIALFLTISCAEEGSANEQEIDSVSSEVENYCPEMKFESLQAQAAAILEAFQKASDSTNANRADAEKSFFCVFPSNYNGIQQIFGYQEDNPPLIDEEMGWEIAMFFADLASIPKEVFYAKYIDLTVNGVNQGEDPAYAFSVGNIIEKDPQNAVTALSKKSQQEIESVFVYLYDEPEIGNLDMAFEYRQKIFTSESPKLAAMHKSVFDALKEKWAKEFEGE